ncbi:MAG: hypothetical protein ABJA71_01640 [Ginsengibacter sp.]
MKTNQLSVVLTCIFLFFSNLLFSQTPKKYFDPGSITEEQYAALKMEFGKYKKIPPSIEKPVLIALSYYPELKETHIWFRIKKRHTPLQTRSSWAGIFKRKEIRDYVITMSDTTELMLTPILFRNISFNQQIGVAGHELAHVADFSTYSSLRIIWHGVRNVSPKYIDKFEFKTDGICIAHGLGYQLLAWSENLRKKMNSINWRGPDYAHKQQNTERYMNPATIQQRINTNPLYHTLISAEPAL